MRHFILWCLFYLQFEYNDEFINFQCFMNSVLQCLSNTRPLLEYILAEGYLSEINSTSSSMKGALIKGKYLFPCGIVFPKVGN